MPYRPQFDSSHLWPPIAALIPATGCAAIFVALSVLPAAVVEPVVKGATPLIPVPQSFADVPGFAITSAMVLVAIAVFAFIAIGCALVVVGVPIAWMIGRHIRHPASLLAAVLAATLAFWFGFGRSGSLTQQPLVLALGLWCALGSAMIYRYFLIRFRDELEED
ncbi:hypothetical protein AAG612_12905 [Citromicrobium bathyomarinum]|uniref:hypothetical protein n=1 Tax=Citromicrobium bathyomarinum TaxID=72174 RepID=UPI003159B631